MAHPIKLLGLSAVCEVDWIVLPDAADARKTEIAKLSRDLRPSHKGLFRPGFGHILGLASTSKASRLKGRRITAAAAWLAASSAQKNLIYVHELEGGQLWLGICQAGAPKPRGDALVGLRSLDERLSELIPAPEEYVFLTDSPTVQDELGHWPWLYRKLDDVLTRKPQRSAQLAPIGMNRSLLWLSTLAVIATTSTVGYAQWHSAKQREAARLATEHARTEKQIPPEQQYLAQFKTWFQASPRVSAIALASTSLALANKLEINVNGWSLTELICKPDGCSASYRRNALAGELHAGQIGARSIQYDAGRADALFALSLASTKLADNLQPADVARLFPAERQIQWKLIEALHRLGDLGMTASHSALKPLSGIALPSSALQVSQGNWSLAGDPDAVLDTLQQLGSQLLGSVCHIEIGERVVLKSQGEYLEASWRETPPRQATTANTQ